MSAVVNDFHLKVGISPHVLESANDVDCVGAADHHPGVGAVPVTITQFKQNKLGYGKSRLLKRRMSRQASLGFHRWEDYF